MAWGVEGASGGAGLAGVRAGSRWCREVSGTPGEREWAPSPQHTPYQRSVNHTLAASGPLFHNHELLIYSSLLPLSPLPPLFRTHITSLFPFVVSTSIFPQHFYSLWAPSLRLENPHCIYSHESIPPTYSPAPHPPDSSVLLSSLHHMPDVRKQKNWCLFPGWLMCSKALLSQMATHTYTEYI